MGKAGILTEDDRVELIEGEIVQLPAIGGPHAACVNRSTRLFVSTLGELAIVSVQNPVWLDDWSEPLPDIALLKPQDDFYASGSPKPSDTLLAIEVSDTTLRYDRSRKLPLYAVRGIPESWIVDIGHDRIEAHWGPSADGYRYTRVYSRGESISPQAFPSLAFPVDAILG